MKRFTLLLFLGAHAAVADPLDTFGFGARASALAGATTADTSGAEAAHANPAAVALAEHPEVMIGWGYAHMGLGIDGRDAELLDAHGADLGIALPIKIGDVRTAFGAAIYLPDAFLARIQLIPATEPHFILLDNDVHRVVVEPVYAVQLGPHAAIGAGASILTDATSSGIQFDVGVVGGQPEGNGALDVTLPTRIAPLAGLWISPIPRLRFAATYRGELDLTLRLPIVANVDVAGVITGDALIDVRAVNYFTPQRATGAVSFDVTPDLTVNAEVSWVDWAAFHGGAPDVRILIALGITPPLVQTLFPADAFHSTIVPRAGAELRLPRTKVDLSLRAAVAWEPTPVPPQTGLTNFADNDRLTVGFGAGIKLKPFTPTLKRPISLDVGLQLQHLRDRLTIKDQSIYPGQALESSGDIVRASATLKIEF